MMKFVCINQCQEIVETYISMVFSPPTHSLEITDTGGGGS